MPVIPRTQLPTLQKKIVTQAPIKPFDVSSGLQQASKTMSNVADLAIDYQNKKSKAQAESALIDFEREKNEILFNPTDGYYNTQGRDAVEQYTETQKRLDAALVKYRDQLKDDTTTMNLFNTAANNRIARDQQQMFQHSAKGQQTWDLANAKNSLDVAKNNAQLFYNDPERLRVQLASAELSVFDAAKITGQDPSVDLIDARSGVIKSAIDGAIVHKDYETAKQLREQYDNVLINDVDRMAVDKSLAAVEKSQAVEGYIVDIYSPDKPLGQMLKEARAIEDPEQRKDVESRIGSMFTRDEKARNEYKEATFNDVAKKIEGGASYDDLYAQNPNSFDALDPAERESLRVIENKRIKREAIVTDPATLVQLTGLTDEQLIKENLSKYRTNLSDKDYTDLVERRRRAIDGKTNDGDKFSRTKSQALTATIKQIYGDKPTPEQINNFSRFVGEQANVENIQTMGEYEELLSKSAGKFVRERSFWFDKEDETIKAIPSEYLTDLATELKRAGKPVTPENLFNLYQLADDKGLLQ